LSGTDQEFSTSFEH